MNTYAVISKDGEWIWEGDSRPQADAQFRAVRNSCRPCVLVECIADTDSCDYEDGSIPNLFEMTGRRPT